MTVKIISLYKFYNDNITPQFDIKDPIFAKIVGRFMEKINYQTLAYLLVLPYICKLFTTAEYMSYVAGVVSNNPKVKSLVIDTNPEFTVTLDFYDLIKTLLYEEAESV